MSHGGVPNWPPIWTHGYSQIVKTITGEVGILKHVMILSQMPTQCYLVIEYEGERYAGCLLFDDGTFCQQIRKLLQCYLGYSTKEIGNLDLSYTL
jgi:hypothetical protein